MEQIPLLTLNKVRVTVVATGNKILDIEQLDITKGTILGIMGVSGEGKSIFLKTIMGLLDAGTFYTEGSIVACANDQCALLDQLDEEERYAFNSKFLSFIPQEPTVALNPIYKIGKQLIEGRKNNSENNRKIGLIAKLKLLSIKDPERLYNSYPHQISGGQLQRALIASALIRETPLILADEPVSSLDSINTFEIIKILNWIKSEFKKTIIVVSHDLHFLQAIADEILELHEGQLRSIPKPKQNVDVKENIIRSSLVSKAPFITLKNINVTFTKSTFWKSEKVNALKNISFEIFPGDCVGLVGESGSGKSTIARLLAGLITEFNGKLMVKGEIFEDMTVQMRAKLIQMIFQDPYQSLNPKMSVKKALMEVIKKYQTGNSEKILRKLLDDVGIDPTTINRYPHQFSGGQRQRIAIARSLSVSPKLLVCDEITSNLDSEIQQNILLLLKNLHFNHGMSLLFISHDIKIVKMITNRIIIFKEGRIVEEGSTAQIFTNPQQEYTKMLLNI